LPKYVFTTNGGRPQHQSDALSPHPHLDEISGVGFDQIGIELMLADQLAEAVANFGAVVVSVLAIDRLGWDLLRLPGGRGRSCNDPISSTEPMPLP